MVGNLAENRTVAEEIVISTGEIVEQPLKWCSVSLSEVQKSGKRLEASLYDVEAKVFLQAIHDCKYEKKNLIAAEGFVREAHYGGRLKRNYVKASTKNARGFIGSAEMLDVYPQPIKFMAMDKKAQALKVEGETILLSRSGTIGNVTFVNKTLEKFLISEHAIRLICKEFAGYVYTFLRSKIGKKIVESKVYGAVIQQVEPEHLAEIPVPNPPKELKEKIHNLIIRSFELRDESNELIDKATSLLVEELSLPPIESFGQELIDKDAEVQAYNVKLSEMANRLDGSYHVPIVNAIIYHLEKHSKEVTTIGDERISKEVILPGRFKRVYVEEGIGRIFIGGKQLYELDPSNKKYLSLVHHADRIAKQLELKENMLLITCSGTIGKTSLVPKHWENWTANQHIIRVVPANNEIAGYLSIFLSTEYGYELITRFTYGSVVDEIDNRHISQIKIPLLKNEVIQEKINTLALEANAKRYEAYQLEQEALRIMNDEVIFAE